ncbi:MAG: phosphoribosylglycinamide formyltransferase [Gammaproteobacteria bacterium AqS3]|nr:phosphoribosylglycinamide formyltransferase [Gammaproteobacteria bacterium AqS3]
MTALAVLISGNGSNLQAILDSPECSGAKVRCVISNRPDAHGLERARRAGIATRVVPHRGLQREEFDARLLQCVLDCSAELVVLAGFMRILTPVFTAPLAGRLVNIHPSLLPKYPGLNTHARAIEAGDVWHGASVHFVTEELDGGPVIAHARLRIQAGESPEDLRQRVHAVEHRLYPRSIAHLCSGAVTFRGGAAYLGDQLIPPQGLRLDSELRALTA